MLRTILISAEGTLAGQLANTLAATGKVGVVRALDRYPVDQDLARIIRAHAPQLFFVDAGNLTEALRVARAVGEDAPGAQVVAFDRVCDHLTLLNLMRAGIREFVAIPDSSGELEKALERVQAALERTPPSIAATDEVIAFLPAKPGVGCSTVALNTSMALAAHNGTRVLLMDFDLSCGMIAFLLHLEPERSLVDAVERAPELDEELWAKLVTTVRGVDVLPAGPIRPGFRIELPAMRYLLNFARRNYDVICVDLSGLMEWYSVELMQEAKRIYMVCTPELPALHLARKKLECLRSLELDPRVTLLLNRAQKRAVVSAADIARLTGLPVEVEIPNDSREVDRALEAAKPVGANTELGKCFNSVAARILSKEAGPKPAKRFVEYFSLSPASYTMGSGLKSE